MKKEIRNELKETVRQFVENGLTSSRAIAKKLKQAGLYNVSFMTISRIKNEIKKETPKQLVKQIKQIEPQIIKVKKVENDRYIRVKCPCGFTHKLLKSNPNHLSECGSCGYWYVLDKGYWLQIKTNKKIYPHEIKIEVKPSKNCKCGIPERVKMKMFKVEQRLGIRPKNEDFGSKIKDRKIFK